MIRFRQRGNFNKTEKYLKNASGKNWRPILEKHGEMGVRNLAAETPLDSGETASSWNYEIIQNKNTPSIAFNNTNVVDGVNIAVIIQYGHRAKDGTWVEGVDYINVALKPVSEKLAAAVWKEVSLKYERTGH